MVGNNFLSFEVLWSWPCPAPLPDIALHTLAQSPESVPSKDVILAARSRKRVILNVGGVRHEVMWKMLEQYPASRLGQLAKVESHQQIMELVSDYSLSDNQYFFDRSNCSTQ